MRRREFIPGIGGVEAWPLAARAQQRAVPVFLAVVFIVLLLNGLLEIGFADQQHKVSLIRIQHEQAEAVATKIGSSSRRSKAMSAGRRSYRGRRAPPNSGGSTGTAEQRRFDGSRLLRQVPAITDLAQLDATGKEQLRQSKLATDVIGSLIDFSHEAKFTEAVAKKVYYGPVYFRRESEPYMTLALAGIRRDAGDDVVRAAKQAYTGALQAQADRAVAVARAAAKRKRAAVS